jgi:hypothetical protein
MTGNPIPPIHICACQQFHALEGRVSLSSCPQQHMRCLVRRVRAGCPDHHLNFYRRVSAAPAFFSRNGSSTVARWL